MSQFDVDVQAEVPLSEGLPGLVEQAAVATLNHQGVASPAGLTILLTGDAHVQQLNRDFLGEDRPTDVLSFPAGDPLPAQAGEMAGYLGDVAIALPTAGRQAAAAGHSLAA
ncbi:MAG: rRNA maturation RNase YbeY, partial [Chloroflexi bacterium]|nr:rRNA maturation RNase YbeY [Chloroflexota bacterium]